MCVLETHLWPALNAAAAAFAAAAAAACTLSALRIGLEICLARAICCNGARTHTHTHTHTHAHTHIHKYTHTHTYRYRHTGTHTTHTHTCIRTHTTHDCSAYTGAADQRACKEEERQVRTFSLALLVCWFPGHALLIVTHCWMCAVLVTNFAAHTELWMCVCMHACIQCTLTKVGQQGAKAIEHFCRALARTYTLTHTHTHTHTHTYTHTHTSAP